MASTSDGVGWTRTILSCVADFSFVCRVPLPDVVSRRDWTARSVFARRLIMKNETARTMMRRATAPPMIPPSSPFVKPPLLPLWVEVSSSLLVAATFE